MNGMNPKIAFEINAGNDTLNTLFNRDNIKA
jgi:hypothetical protein